MASFFQNIRIKRYLRFVDSYVQKHFSPEEPKEVPNRLQRMFDEDIRFSLPHKPEEVMYSLSDEPEKEAMYSHRDAPEEPMYSLRGEPNKNQSRRQYSLSPGPKKQEKEVAQYSHRGSSQIGKRSDGIPNRGDQFYSERVSAVLSDLGIDTDFGTRSSSLDNYLNLTFVDMVTRYINILDWRDSKVYKAAQMDRRLFSKIMSDRNYKPSKDTALALAIGLKLNLIQVNDLLSRAGYVLSHSSKRDVIIEYFIREGKYNLSDINEVLYRLDQKIIGR